MKNILKITFLLSFCVITAQNSNQAVTTNQAGAFTSGGTVNAQAAHGSATFYNPKRDIKGSEYLFDQWDNNAVIHTIDKQRFLMRNMNLNINRNSFISKISSDSIFTLNWNNIDRIVIDNKTYKNVFSDSGKRIYEMVYEGEDFTLLKGFKVQLVSGSPNPMVNRADDRFVRKISYYIHKDNSIKPIKLSKKKMLNLFAKDPKRMAKFDNYMKTQKLSFKKESDLKRGFEYSKLN